MSPVTFHRLLKRGAVRSATIKNMCKLCVPYAQCMPGDGSWTEAKGLGIKRTLRRHTTSSTIGANGYVAVRTALEYTKGKIREAGGTCLLS
jgi:hypothetical protein